MVMRGIARTVGAIAGAGAVVVATAMPGAAVPPPVSQAWGSALTVSLGGQNTGTGEFEARHDGKRMRTVGRNKPILPLLDGQQTVVGGSLGQDATASSDGDSAACAGVVGRDGSVEVGPHGSCLTGNDGRIVLSLGELPELGLGTILPELPKLPEIPELPKLPTDLPDLGLRLVGQAITARCDADKDSASGSSKVADLELVGVLDGKEIPLLSIPPSGTTVGLGEILSKLGIPGLDELLAQLPSDQLPSDVLVLRTDEQVREKGRLTVTALRVAVAPTSLADIRVAKVTCGPNRELVHARPTSSPTPSPVPTNRPAPTSVPTAVPAGLASMPGATPVSSGLGVGTLALLGLGGLALGVLLHRRRRTS